MSTLTVTPSAIDDATAAALLRAIVDRDDDRLRSLLTSDVWLRALLVRTAVEVHDRDRAVALFTEWFGEAVEAEVLHAETRPVGTRHHLAYRFRLRPAWEPGVWHIIEQTGYARIVDGRVRRLDLACTGYVPEVVGAGGTS